MTLRTTGLRVAIGALGLSLLSPASPATASPPPDAPSPHRVGLPTVISVQAKHVGNVDRVTFRFKHGLPQSLRDNYVVTMHPGASGRPARVAGTKVLMIVFYGSKADTATRKAFALPNVITVVGGARADGGPVAFGLGVQRSTSYTVTELEHPARVVVDVRAGFPTTTGRVWFVDSNAVRTGNEPYVVPRQRPLRSDAPETAALQALFAGPRPRELTAGLRLVRSHAWGFRDLRIANHVARIRLTRGCRTSGSTITVAGEISATLKQFPSVDWVKIYGPSGGTERPHGQVDSIPSCLEP